MKLRVMASLTAACLAVISPSYAASTANCSYTYADSFETNRAEVDNWGHSDFVEVLPQMHLYGVLMYPNGLGPDRALGFYGGFDCWAWLSYRFPLTPTPQVVRGEVEFDIYFIPTMGPECMVTVMYDSTAGAPQEIGPGRHILGLAPPAPCASVEVMFSGDGLALDNLVVRLEDVTPARRTTWGRVKALYR